MQIGDALDYRPLDIVVRTSFREGMAVRLLNWLANENALILRADPSLPGLYESGVVYQRETVETWSDYLAMLEQGWEDCDALAAARAGELIARGHRALAPGDGGYEAARRLKLRSIPAEVFLRTRTEPGERGMFHCIVRYQVGDRWYRDDPSARLGMYDGEFRPNPWGNSPEPRRDAA
ncbi:hypothetical protein L6R53_15805 [Myxococcota bacterium]|nr:hypothetical protein [Myxococcota bacterium]